MSNLLTPPGLVPRHLYVRTNKHNHLRQPPPDANLQPMPGRPGALIFTEKGVRSLQLAVPQKRVLHCAGELRYQSCAHLRVRG